MLLQGTVVHSSVGKYVVAGDSGTQPCREECCYRGQSDTTFRGKFCCKGQWNSLAGENVVAGDSGTQPCSEECCCRGQSDTTFR